MLDSHQHFWTVARGDYGWMGDHVAPLLRDFGPADLAPLMARTGIAQTILVQAAETEAELEFLLDLAASTAFVAGVVGWLDMDGDGFAVRLDRLRAHPKFVGLRPMLQELRDNRFILRPRVLENLARVARAGLAFDVLSFQRHLPHVRDALARTPGLRALVNHLSKPPIAAGTLDPWREQIAALAALPGVSCKLSGLVTEADNGWTPERLQPYVDYVVDCFGPDRLMFGSDWPVCTLQASYAEVVNATRMLLGRYSGPAEMDEVFDGNARRFYLGD